MDNFQTTFNSNTTSANEALKSLGSFFKTEKTKLQEIRTGLKTDHETFQATLSSQISQLKDELIKESNIKDSLALKSEEAKIRGCSGSGFIPKQGGEGADVKKEPKPKAPVKPVAPVQPDVKKEPKLKEKLFSDDPFIDNEEEEVSDENEQKRRKAREAKLDEHQRIIREAEEKERA
ncbi:unnamed protein product [Lactuca virosa]|uniref:Uncharacterized protein n=1 Tax=Lactuca virosa TaxID=75947 RepID=A0AAU9MXL0_9ASTR|nr:unnamed protein product [Lactuca virosa]